MYYTHHNMDATLKIHGGDLSEEWRLTSHDTGIPLRPTGTWYATSPDYSQPNATPAAPASARNLTLLAAGLGISRAAAYRRRTGPA